jgi:hypothetical protein
LSAEQVGKFALPQQADYQLNDGLGETAQGHGSKVYSFIREGDVSMGLIKDHWV